MAELRRLLIEPKRLKDVHQSDLLISLARDEFHYLKNVLRLRQGDSIEIINGNGGLWVAELQKSNVLKLTSSISNPVKQEICPSPLIGLAVVLPKKGFEEVLRMCCELGIDLFQPLFSKRSAKRISSKSHRWNLILKESVEQSERLWSPKILPIVDASSWWSSHEKNSGLAIATTRMEKANDINLWMDRLNFGIKQVWISIGPEGGWTSDEELEAISAGWTPIELGDSILRTSTAAVAASQSIVSRRRAYLSINKLS